MKPDTAMGELVDLHTHSSASDGTLSPEELVRQAALAGIGQLALTDHDTLVGLPFALEAAAVHGLRLIPGVEISLNWRKQTLHVLGLNLDFKHLELNAGLVRIQALRHSRAEAIGMRLDKIGIPGCLAAASALAGGGMITRTHFARHLMNQGLVRVIQDAFDRYLGRGKPAYVSITWPDLEQGVQWINQAGGIAVLAHPLRYHLSATALRELLTEFRAYGGLGMEVVCGAGNPVEMQNCAHYARKHQMLASVGSDYHGPQHHAWLQLGKLPSLPQGLDPVWEQWGDDG